MFNKETLHEDLQEYFRLNEYVDLAVNFDMDNQSVDRIQIRKADYSKNLLFLYQPGSSKVKKGQSINISRLYLGEQRPSLFGSVIHAETNFFIMRYTPEIRFINLRRGFRVDPKILFDISGMIEINNQKTSVSETFILKDLSITGVGFLSKENRWDPQKINKKLDIECKIHLNFVNKNTQSEYEISGSASLVRVIQTANGQLEGYEFMGEKSEYISKIVMDSQIAHKQAETKYYK